MFDNWGKVLNNHFDTKNLDCGLTVLKKNYALLLELDNQVCVH